MLGSELAECASRYAFLLGLRAVEARLGDEATPLPEGADEQPPNTMEVVRTCVGKASKPVDDANATKGPMGGISDPHGGPALVAVPTARNSVVTSPTLNRRASIAGDYIAAVTLGIQKDEKGDKTKEKLAAARSAVEVVQYVEETAELCTHLTLTAGYVALSLIALCASKSAGGEDAAMRLVRSFPALGASIDAEGTADDVDFELLPLVVVARGSVATLAALFGDWLCWLGEHWVSVDSGRLVMQRAGMTLLALKATYMFTQWVALAISEAGLVLANSLPSSTNGTALIGNGTALFNLAAVANP